MEEEYKKLREEEDIFRGYVGKPDAKNPTNHHGYLIVERVKIKKAKGISYSENEFLGELKKEVLKPNLVLLTISTAGKVFDNFYSETITKDSNYYGFNYHSNLKNLILTFVKQRRYFYHYQHQRRQTLSSFRSKYYW